MCGAWGRQCYFGNNVRNAFQCVFQGSFCVQNSNEIELIITLIELIINYVFIKHTCQTGDITTFAESAIYIFANNLTTKRDGLLW